MSGKSPISAIVVGLNEAEFLPKALPSLSFCEEVIYIDLGSSDSSLECAIEWGATACYQVPREDSVEAVLAKHLDLARHRWVFLCDPDEEVNKELSRAIESFFVSSSIGSETGCISVRWQFFAGKRPLKGTPWGGSKRKAVLFNRNLVEFVPEVHRGKRLGDGCRELDLPAPTDAALNHYWLTSLSIFLEKHKRYIRLERDLLRGDRTVKTVLVAWSRWPVRFVEGYVLTKGYLDGFVGLFLSLHWATYQTQIQYKDRLN